MTDVSVIETRAQSMLTTARSIDVIHDADSCKTALMTKQLLSGFRMGVVEFFRPLKQSADQHKKLLLERERAVLDPVQTEEERISKLIVAYDDEQERLRAITQKRAQEDAQIAEAAVYEQLGDKETAQQVLDGNGVVQVTVEKGTPKVDGVSIREVWSAEVTDLMALVRAVADAKAPLAYLQANKAALNTVARAQKTELNTIPGVRAVCNKTVVGRR